MYLYECHQHTALCSGCGQADPEALIRALKADGFAGVVLTEHFYHGNTAINRNLPWEEFVRPYEEGYLRTKEIGERYDIDVLFGLEEGIGDGKEVLLYGLTPAAVYAHPELRDAGLPEIAAIVRREGGLVFQAHPFRVTPWIPRPWEELPAACLDGVESDNAHNQPLQNARAAQFAEKYGLLRSAGTDAHTADEAGRFGIACDHRIRTEAELAQVLRAGDYELHTPPRG